MRPLLFPLCCVLPLASCQKVQEMFGKAKTVVQDTTSAALPSAAKPAAAPEKPAGGEIDPVMAEQVAKGEDGVSFRKDKPFPTLIQSRKVTRIGLHQARLVRRSVIGNDLKTIDGNLEIISRWQRSGDQIEVWMEKLAFELPPEKLPKVDPNKPAAPKPAEPMPIGKPVTPEQLAAMKALYVLSKETGRWQADGKRGGDFARVAWQQALDPGFTGAAVEAGVLPHTMWFGSKARWKPGMKVTLEGSQLQVLSGFPKNKGSLQLKFEEVEAVGGHPCGRFDVSGDLTSEGRIYDDGTRNDLEISITSGKIWFSLLYPVVMKQELDTVLTLSSDSGGVPTKIQGKADIVTSCEWKSEP